MTFLVDANLPRFFSKFEAETFIFADDINQNLPDSELWKLAMINDYIILTRDMDFITELKNLLSFLKS